MQERNRLNFRSAFFCIAALSQILGVSVVVVVIIWTKKYLGGYGWTGSELQFNVHPLCMVAGFVFCMAEALAAVFKANHGAKVYSLHSWCGLTTLAIFCLQFIIGFVMYMVPHIPFLSKYELPEGYKSSYMPGHRYFGMALLFMCAITCISGLTEYLSGYYGGEKLEDVARVGNSLGLLIIAFVMTAGFILHNDKWKRGNEQYEDLDETNQEKFIEERSGSSSINE